MGKDYSDIAFVDDGRLKLLIIVGTRPEVIRLSEVIKKCRRHFDCLLAHTGQNYDYTLNGIFFRDLSLDDPDVYLDAVGADLGETAGNIIAASYRLMVQVQPDALLILGDTNSCLSAIAAKRLHIPIFHMEAGNRCKDECLPEETNRRIVDVISDVNLAYSEHARRYLKDTGCAPERTYVTGSPMAEVLRANLGKIEASDILSELGLEPKRYMLLSAHREENIDTEANFTSLFTAINALAEKYGMPILYSCHPRSRKRLEATGFKLDWYITIPCIKDMIKTVVILTVTGGFMLYNEVYFLTKGAAGTTSLAYILRELSVVSSRMQYARANVIGVVQIVGGLLLIGIINLLFKIDLSVPLRKIALWRSRHEEKKQNP